METYEDYNRVVTGKYKLWKLSQSAQSISNGSIIPF